MNMIPLVRATEPGIAQTVNLGLGLLNCSLEKLCQCGVRCKSLWKKATERVRFPSRRNIHAYGRRL